MVSTNELHEDDLAMIISPLVPEPKLPFKDSTNMNSQDHLRIRPQEDCSVHGDAPSPGFLAFASSSAAHKWMADEPQLSLLDEAKYISPFEVLNAMSAGVRGESSLAHINGILGGSFFHDRTQKSSEYASGRIASMLPQNSYGIYTEQAEIGTSPEEDENNILAAPESMRAQINNTFIPGKTHQTECPRQFIENLIGPCGLKSPLLRFRAPEIDPWECMQGILLAANSYVGPESVKIRHAHNKSSIDVHPPASGGESETYLDDLGGLKAFYMKEDSQLELNFSSTPKLTTGQQLSDMTPVNVGLPDETDDDSGNELIISRWPLAMKKALRSVSLTPETSEIVSKSIGDSQEPVDLAINRRVDSAERCSAVVRSRRLYYMSSNDDNSFNEWKIANAVFKPLNLILSSDGSLWIFGRGKDNRRSIHPRMDSPSNYLELDFHSQQELAGPVHRSPLGFLKVFLDAKKPFKWVVDMLQHIRSRNIGQLDESAPENSESNDIPAVINAIDSVRHMSQTNRVTFSESGHFQLLGVDDEHNAGSSDVARNTAAANMYYPKSSPEILLANFFRHVRTTLKVWKFLIGTWYEEQIRYNSMWHTLSLDKFPQCRRFRQEYARAEDKSLFYQVKSRLLSMSFKDYVLLLASLEHKKIVEFEDKTEEVEVLEEIIVGSTSMIGLQSFISPMEPVMRLTSSQGPDRENLNATNSSRCLPYKEFIQISSEEQRKEMRAFLWLMVEQCHELVFNATRGSNVEDPLAILDSFRECFELIGEQYAKVARTQVVNYLNHILEIRQHILLVFDDLDVVGYEYAGFLEFLGTSVESPDTLVEAQCKMAHLMLPLTDAGIYLEGVAQEIRRMRTDNLHYFDAMIKVAQDAGFCGKEILDAYHDFCVACGHNNMDEFHNHTRVKNFIHELEFVMENKGLFHRYTFEDTLGELNTSNEIVGSVRADLEEHIQMILKGVASKRFLIRNTDE